MRRANLSDSGRRNMAGDTALHSSAKALRCEAIKKHLLHCTRTAHVVQNKPVNGMRMPWTAVLAV